MLGLGLSYFVHNTPYIDFIKDYIDEEEVCPYVSKQVECAYVFHRFRVASVFKRSSTCLPKNPRAFVPQVWLQSVVPAINSFGRWGFTEGRTVCQSLSTTSLTDQSWQTMQHGLLIRVKHCWRRASDDHHLVRRWLSVVQNFLAPLCISTRPPCSWSCVKSHSCCSTEVPFAKPRRGLSKHLLI
jgi:hypothetical protein